MLAKEVMTRQVISVTPETGLRDAANTLLSNHVSAVPVIDAQGALVGIVSEGDLIHRSEIGTTPRHAWWQVFSLDPDDSATYNRPCSSKSIVIGRSVTGGPAASVISKPGGRVKLCPLSSVVLATGSSASAAAAQASRMARNNRCMVISFISDKPNPTTNRGIPNLCDTRGECTGWRRGRW